jgi:shikimate kinase
MSAGRIFLVGFMGTGKSTVGRLLAEALGLGFADLDADITAAAGQAIPEIFAAEGEAGFRQRERAALLARLEGGPAVIACGGGIVVDPRNRADLRRGGRVFCLRASPETLRARLGDDPNRPLLRQDLGQLLAAREPFYAEFPDQIPTDGLEPEAVAKQILRALA